MGNAFLARLKRWATGTPVPPDPQFRPEPLAELNDAEATRYLAAVCERWEVPIEYFPGDTEHESPEMSFWMAWSSGRDDMECFSWGVELDCADRLADAVRSHCLARAVEEFVRLGDRDEVLPLDALRVAESATDFPRDLSWVVEWSNNAGDGATVAGEAILGFLRSEWADYEARRR